MVAGGKSALRLSWFQQPLPPLVALLTALTLSGLRHQLPEAHLNSLYQLTNLTELRMNVQCDLNSSDSDSDEADDDGDHEEASHAGVHGVLDIQPLRKLALLELRGHYRLSFISACSTALQQLSIRDTPHLMLDPQLLAAASQLRSLSLEAGNILDATFAFDPCRWSALQHLTEVHISKAKLSWLPQPLAFAPGLRLVSLSGITEFEADWLACFSRLTTLESLVVFESGLEHVPPVLCSICILRSLDSRSNQLTSLPDFMSELRHFSTLRSSRNKFQEVPDVLNLITGLHEVDLDHQRVPLRLEGPLELPFVLTHLMQLNLKQHECFDPQSVFFVGQAAAQWSSAYPGRCFPVLWDTSETESDPKSDSE